MRGDQSRPSEGTRGGERGHRKMSPERRIVNREIASRDIGDPMHKVFMHSGIAMSETSIGDKVAVL